MLSLLTLAVAGCGGQRVEKSCGSIEMSAENGAQYFLSRPGLNLLSDCFVSAFQHNESAKIRLRLQGVDTVEVDRWTVHRSRVDEAIHVHNNNGLDSSARSTCTKVVRRFGGILFICKGQDVLYSLNGSPELSNNSF